MCGSLRRIEYCRHFTHKNFMASLNTLKEVIIYILYWWVMVILLKVPDIFALECDYLDLVWAYFSN